MAHYICTGGCGGESDSPGVCEAEDCSKHGQPLEPCECEDGLHEGMAEMPGEEKATEEPE